jgi:hypothetical protein
MNLSQIDRNHWVATSKQMGVRLDDSGKGPFHNLASDVKLVVYGDKTGVHYQGYETHMDKDGDKMIWEIRDNPAARRIGVQVD